MRYLLALPLVPIICLAAAPKVLAEVSVKAASDKGKALTLTFSGDAVTETTEEATLCSEPRAALAEAKLWMPDMGHGSSPTSLTRGDEGCTKVADINFLMPGAWQIKVRFADGDHGVFDVQVQ